jgi:UDP-N-acetylmuramoyl-L-alanyl-D-glutamate--2,6-diaminopimelate ligase
MTKKNMPMSRIYPVTCHTDNIGPGSTFVAIHGHHQNGASFIKEAIERGAEKILLERNDYRSEFDTFQDDGIKFVFVNDARRALADYAAKALENPTSQLKIIGVTGTKGKTTTIFLMEHILKSAGKKTAMLGTIYNRILDETYETSLTTPNSDYLQMFFAECVRQEVEYVVMEVSSNALLTERVYGIPFEHVAFTNLASEHMDSHKTMGHYFQTKCRLFRQVKEGGSIVVNADDSWGQKALGIAQQYDGVQALELHVTDHFIDQKLCPALIGRFNGYNIAMALFLSRIVGIEMYKVKEALLSFEGVPGRLQKHRLQNGAVAYIDFAHNPSSMESVLQALRPLTKHLIVLFGCGGDKDKAKRPLMGALAAKYADEVIVTNDNPRNEDPQNIVNEICAGIKMTSKEKVVCELDRVKAISIAVAKSHKDSVIAILGKGHENYYLAQGKKIHFDDFEQIENY